MTNNLWFSVWRIGIVLIVSGVGIFFWRLLLKYFELRLKKLDHNVDRIKHLTTIIHAGYSIGNVFIILLVILMILHELGINITPILASAGVVGLAFSLGSQTIIKDFLAGIINLSENNFSIGDIITIGTSTGTVENITLRAIYLRDVEGKLIVIPNGDVRSYSNLTIKWSQTIITMNFNFDVDMAQVTNLLEEAVRQTNDEKEVGMHIKGEPTVSGYTGFTDWAVQAQIIAKTHPGKQWQVAMALRKNALEMLKDNGITMAIPVQKTVT